MDATEDFRSAALALARRLGLDEGRLKSVASSLVLQKPLSKSSFMDSANEIKSQIKNLREYISEKKKIYMDMYRSSDKERDLIEHEVMNKTKICHKSIEALKDSISSFIKSDSNTIGFTNSGRADYNAHLHGIVLILSENLHFLTVAFDQLRSTRIKKRFQLDGPKRRPSLNQVSAKRSSFDETDLNRHLSPTSESTSNQSHLSVLDEDTLTLQSELSNLLNSTRETERRVMEIATLSQLFSTNVLQQSQQIEMLYNEAVEATNNIEMGNKELKKAVGHNQSNRALLILFFVVMTIAVLFLDWYQ